VSENTNECVIEWIPGRDYVGLTAKNGVPGRTDVRN
jgi:hypothetical protein